MRLSLATFTISFLALSGAVAQEWQPQLVSFATGAAPASVAEHGGFNFGGIRAIGNLFRTYPSAEAGVADMAQLLRSYVRRGYNTL